MKLSAYKIQGLCSYLVKLDRKMQRRELIGQFDKEYYDSLTVLHVLLNVLEDNGIDTTELLLNV